MSRKTVLIGLGAVLVAAGAAVAIAQVGDRGGPGWHRGGDHGGGHRGRWMDHGEDGQDGMMRGEGRRGWGRGAGRSTTTEEFDTRTRERFARLDRNSDGVIDRTEIEASITDRLGQRPGNIEQRVQRMLTRLGADKDGRVTRDKFVENVKKRFAQMDLNSDGRITDEDLPPMMRGRDVLKGGGAGMGPGQGRRGGGRMLDRLTAADANKDGVITLEEAQAHAARRFEQMDRNKDGVIDKADFEALQKETVAYRVQRFLHRFGAGADGKVTREQFSSAAKERFARLDVNGDGRLDRGDFGRGHGHRGMGRGQGGPGGFGGPGGTGADAPAAPGGSAPQR